MRPQTTSNAAKNTAARAAAAIQLAIENDARMLRIYNKAFSYERQGRQGTGSLAIVQSLAAEMFLAGIDGNRFLCIADLASLSDGCREFVVLGADLAKQNPAKAAAVRETLQLAVNAATDARNVRIAAVHHR